MRTGTEPTSEEIAPFLREPCMADIMHRTNTARSAVHCSAETGRIRSIKAILSSSEIACTLFVKESVMTQYWSASISCVKRRSALVHISVGFVLDAGKDKCWKHRNKREIGTSFVSSIRLRSFFTKRFASADSQSLSAIMNLLETLTFLGRRTARLQHRCRDANVQLNSQLCLERVFLRESSVC